MGARRKGRMKVEVLGREYLWYLHREEELRIVSADKRFVVACPRWGERVLHVSGSEFPGIERDEKRPVVLELPAFETAYSLKGLVKRVVEWSMWEGHQIVRVGVTTEMLGAQHAGSQRSKEAEKQRRRVGERCG